MGKRFNHINELRAKAMAGDQMAAKALESLLFVPHHLRQRGTVMDQRARRKGYSGEKTNRYDPVLTKKGVHVTAKTHKAVRCIDAITVSPNYGLDRLQMLKDRREARA